VEGIRFQQLIQDELTSLVARHLPDTGGQLYRQVISLVELPLLTHVLELTGGNQLRAARLLGINRNTLRKRLRLLGITSRGQKGSQRSHPTSPVA
jgi:two-component system nitrogen regulation response regulator GlnG